MQKRELSLVIVLVLLIAVVSFVNPSFFTIDNFLDILKNNVVTLIPTLGMLMVLLIGGIDISIASTMALAGMVVGLLFKYNKIESTLLAFIIALAIGAVCGCLMGTIIGLGNVPPIIATMGGMYIFRALAYIVGDSQWAGAEALGNYKDFALKNICGVNVTIWITLLCYILFFILLKWTKFGRNIYAVGSNAEAAQISGIKVARVKIAVYTIMGVLCGLTGALNTSIYASAQPNSLTGKEMDVIAACVIGGVSMSGGRGTVAGSLLGGLVLAVIAKALPLIKIPAIAQNTIKGVLIVVVIIVNVITQHMMNKRALARREM